MNRVLGIVGRSGSGKTTLIEAMLGWFGMQGVRVNVIKHSHHDLSFEPPGKDSARLRQAGAAEVLVASPYRYAVFHELRDAPEPSLADLLARLAPADLTLVEGYRQAPIARLEVYRPALGQTPLYLETPGMLAVASDVILDGPLPCLPLNDPPAVARFILAVLEGRDDT